MPRKPNAHKTERITINVTPQMRYYLECLVERELYGKTTTEVANNMVARGIENTIERGHMAHPKIGTKNQEVDHHQLRTNTTKSILVKPRQEFNGSPPN